MIYFIQGHNKFVKIGTTNNLPKRLIELQNSNPVKLKLKAIMDGGYQTEAGLHFLFKKYRYKGEWFKYTREVEWFIRAVRKYPNINCIHSLHKESLKMYIEAKAKRLGKEHNLNKRIKKLKNNVRYSSQVL